jgi:hypothetical protein
MQSLPTLSGTPQPGHTLTASAGKWSPEPTGYEYEWQRCDERGQNCQDTGPRLGVTAAKTAGYPITDADVGKTVLVRVFAFSGSDRSQPVYSVPQRISGSVPANTSPPTIVGVARVGSTLDTKQGNWTGSSVVYSYGWQRCDAKGASCQTIPNATASRYTVTSDDTGHTLVVVVTGRNSWGTSSARSAQTAVVVLGGGAPQSTTKPALQGTMQSGKTISASTGSWQSAGSISSYAYAWQRCDSHGANCARIDGATKSSYALGAADVGHTIRVAVTATSAFGSTVASSDPGAVVVAAAGAGATPLPAGGVSIPVADVVAPQRLVVSSVKFMPTRLTSRDPFAARFRVTDTQGHAVRGALVYAVALPYGQVRGASEVQTGGDGWAQIQLLPTPSLSLRRGALVLFVRVRKPGEPLLAGVSSRRLVQVRVGR